MANLHVRDVPDDVYGRLKEMAARNRRSLNAQVVELLDRAVEADDLQTQRQEALERIRQRREAMPMLDPAYGSVEMIREDRAR